MEKIANQAKPSPELARNIANHPCFSGGCHGKSARIHLAVAPACNISCNFCSRKFDCVNESRPGVTSTVLTPKDALARFKVTQQHMGNLAVAGIAGPGDPLANWEKVKETFRLVRRESPDVALCLSTNGLMLPRYASEIAALGVSHVTVTVNAVDPAIGARVYGGIVYEGKRYAGEQAATILLRNQQEGIRLCAEAGLLVKVNTVLIPGVNIEHAPEVARRVKELGAACHNVNALIPVEGTPFGNLEAPSFEAVQQARAACERFLPQIRHCRQCRADAVGLLGKDVSAEMDTLTRKFATVRRIAVATSNGRAVDQHFGHAEAFWVYDVDGFEATLVEKRSVRPFCEGKETCSDYEQAGHKRMALDALCDCSAVVCLMAGPEPRFQLGKHGVVIFDAADAPTEGLKRACAGGSVSRALRAAWDEQLAAEACAERSA
ncbi:nitrogenase cofactor biosynthesis protein NifB [uncultured Senegalimassilia sp.]|uniref:nitrogenase cofactor biosynthesis protein NifB n=1 Tax=uncultured Senegalimassilia sp. TaxID=1714350 RepID=UPI002614D004|nr:nitrogenase cofactor biosynthesis protein NifB [uncultured Senegalimassilia sp.]